MGLKSSTQTRGRSAPAAGVARNIAVFIDGTWDEACPRRSTNVRKLFEATPEDDGSLATHPATPAREQFALYLSGVGTKPRVDARAHPGKDYQADLQVHLRDDLSPLRMPLHRRLVGGMTGKGTRSRIKAAYRFICQHFERERGDKVFIFGFSRGAFAARSLAGFVGRAGLLLADRLQYVERAWELYESGDDPAQTYLSEFLVRLTGKSHVTPDDEEYLPMHFLGAWDTVASLGMPSRLSWFGAPFTEYHQLDVPPAVMTARHALALHELRPEFEPLLWQPGGHPDVKQVWFAGAHADVGGGYRLGEDGLSDAALRWMAEEAIAAGLAIDRGRAWWTPWDSAPALHHGLDGVFAFLTLPRPRDWLAGRRYESDCREQFLHRSAVGYLQGPHPGTYAFRLSHVNRALRTVDDLAVQAAVHLGLMGQRLQE